ncbi:MAG TPA: hypothetical protein VK009_10560 [Chloroflexota bacterium]|nr:hypothetical protein [Chloroflexota bacterium]
MKFTTLRNLMASMLVVGVAGSVIAVGNGTFALFNATTQNTSNTFTTDDLTLNDNGCTNKASTNAAATCTSLLTLANMIPGDAKVGKFYIKNASSKAAFSLTLTVTDAASGTQTVSTVAPNRASGSGGGGLGLFLFSCRNSSSAPVDCTTGSPTKIVSIYATSGSNTCTAGTSITLAGSTFDSTAVTVSPTDESISINGVNCKPGNDATAIASLSNVAINGPDTVTSNGTTNNNVFDFFGTSTSGNYGIDQYGIIINLPGDAGNAFAGGSSNSNSANLTLAWKATQVVGQAQ